MVEKTELKLHRNVQFLYEQALARLELVRGFDLNPEFDAYNPWGMTAPVNGQRLDILDRSAYIAQVGDAKTTYAHLIQPAYQGGRYNRTRSVNQYLTHWIYPYKGKFHPQMVRALLNVAQLKPGATVLDPFVGSGTAALESQLLGYNFVGIDISPLCALLTKVKTQSYKYVDQIQEAVSKIQTAGGNPELLIAALDRREPAEEAVLDFIEIARLVTCSDVERRGRDEASCFERNLRNMLESVRAMADAIVEFEIRPGTVKIHNGDCRDLRKLEIEKNSVDAVVTSPPYSLALDYVKNDEHALRAMRLDTKKAREDFIGVRGKPSQRLGLYNSDMRTVFLELGRVVRPDGLVIMVVGDATVDKAEYSTTDHMIGWAQDAGLAHEQSLSKIVFGLYNVMSDEKILIFRKGTARPPQP